MPTSSRPWNRFENTTMKNILTLLLLALPFATMNAQVQKGKNSAKPDTAQFAKRLQQLKANNSAIMQLDSREVPQEETKKEKSDAALKAPAQKGDNSAACKATFPGGERAIRDFVRKNVRYPEECKQARSAGKAIVAVTVKPDGTLSGFAIHRSSGNSHMDKEALRVARLMPKWTPAEDVEKGCEFKYLLSVSFRPGR